MDTGILVELLCLGHTSIKLVIAQAGIDRRLESSELLGHTLLDNRTHATIDNITSNQDKVGIFSIHHIHPARQLLAGIVIADMQIARHHNIIFLSQWFCRLQVEGNTLLMMIMQIAINKHTQHQHQDANGSVAIMIEE